MFQRNVSPASSGWEEEASQKRQQQLATEARCDMFL
jgi:hypothetical protein